MDKNSGFLFAAPNDTKSKIFQQYMEFENEGNTATQNSNQQFPGGMGSMGMPFNPAMGQNMAGEFAFSYHIKLYLCQLA